MKILNTLLSCQTTQAAIPPKPPSSTEKEGSLFNSALYTLSTFGLSVIGGRFFKSIVQWSGGGLFRANFAQILGCYVGGSLINTLSNLPLFPGKETDAEKMEWAQNFVFNLLEIGAGLLMLTQSVPLFYTSLAASFGIETLRQKALYKEDDIGDILIRSGIAMASSLVIAHFFSGPIPKRKSGVMVKVIMFPDEKPLYVSRGLPKDITEGARSRWLGPQPKTRLTLPKGKIFWQRRHNKTQDIMPHHSGVFHTRYLLDKVYAATRDPKVRILEIGAGKKIPDMMEKYIGRPVTRLNIVTPDGDARYVRASATNLPYKKNEIDVIYSSATIEYIGPEAYREIHRVLKTGGECFVYGHARWSGIHWVMRLLISPEEGKKLTQWAYRSPQHIRKTFEPIGFTVKDIVEIRKGLFRAGYNFTLSKV